MNGRHGCWRWAILSGVLLAGCSRTTVVSFPTWLPEREPYQPISGSGNGYDGYCIAAQAVERDLSEKDLRKVNFTNSDKRNFLSKMSGALGTLNGSMGRVQRFEFRPVEPLEVPPFHAGWRLLGQAQVWQVELAMEAKNPSAAVSALGKAYSFGKDMLMGDAASAGLGIAVMDQARGAICANLPLLSAGDLARVAEIAVSAEPSLTNIDPTLTNEAENGVAAIQLWQDKYQSKEFKSLNKNFQLGSKDIVDYLIKLEPASDDRVKFFQNLDQTRKAELAQQLGRNKIPVLERKEYAQPPVGGKLIRTWSRYFLQSGRTTLEQVDLTLTRTRLMGIYGRFLAAAKRSEKLPAQLPKDASQFVDPFSGRQLIFHSNGMEFEAYSVGADGRDDGGKTSDLGLTPDIRLEGN